MGREETITQKEQPRDAELLGRASLHKTGKRDQNREKKKEKDLDKSKARKMAIGNIAG
jgi:hypothetical protein